MRIWDLIFVEGCRILILASFSILKLFEKPILAADSTHGLVAVLDEITSGLFDADILMDVCLL